LIDVVIIYKLSNILLLFTHYLGSGCGALYQMTVMMMMMMIV